MVMFIFRIFKKEVNLRLILNEKREKEVSRCGTIFLTQRNGNI